MLRRFMQLSSAWKKCFVGLTALVVFATTYMLILPAITAESETYCGIEEHTHNSSCYAEGSRLTCTVEEEEGHQHNDDCYQTEVLLSCGLEEDENHVHGEDCYTETSTLICEMEESEGHIHSDPCYETRDLIVCGQDEHVHTLACYSNPNADIEKKEDWEKIVAGAELTGDPAQDVIAVAKTQLGYTESTENFAVSENGEKMGYTRYGAWTGEPYADWSETFVAFVYHYAGINSEPAEAYIYHSIEEVLAGGYIPKPGDTVLFSSPETGEKTGMGLIYSVKREGETLSGLSAIEGDSDNTVKLNQYEIEDEAILGFGELPAGEESTVISAGSDETEDVPDSEDQPQNFSEENTAEAFLVEVETTESEQDEIETQTVNEKYSLKKSIRLCSAAAPLSLDDTDKYDMSQYITTVNIQHREKDTDLWENITDGTVKVGDKLRFDISYELPEGTLDAANRTIHYEVPENITITKGETGTVKDASGAGVGDYVINLDGSITITFYEDYATKNAGGSKINGHIAFESSVDNIEKDDDGNITLPFQQDITLAVKDPYGDIKVEKTSYDVDHFNGTMKYRIEVSSERGTGGNVVVQDIATNILGKAETAQIVNQDGSDVTVLNISADGNTWTFPPLDAGGKYIITYDAELWPSAMQNLKEKNQNVTATNKAVASSTDTEGQPIKWESSVQDTFARNIINKYGEIRDGETNIIHWTIKINTVSAARTDLSGWRLSDDFNGNVLDPNKDVTIAPNPATGTGSITTHLPYTFPQGSAVTEYTITYTTEGDENAVNNAVLTAPDGGTIGTGGVTPGRADIKKTATGQDIIGKDENENVLVEQNWHVDLSTTTVIRPDRVAYLAGIMSDNRNVLPNGGYWEILERLGDNKKMWFTPEQAAVTAANMAKALTDSGYVGNYYIFAYDPNKEVFRLIDRSEGSDPYYNQATAWKNLSSGEAFDRYDRIFMAMDNSWGPNKALGFDVVSTLNAGTQRITVNVSNSVTCHDGNFEISNGASQSYSPILSKYDYRKQSTMSTAIQPTEYNIEDVGVELQWGIRINLPANIDYTEDVIITDTLPEGLAMSMAQSGDGGLYYYSAWLYGNKDVFGQNKSYPLYIDGTNSASGLTITAQNGAGVVKSQSNDNDRIYYTYGQYVDLNGSQCPQEIQMRIPAAMANKIKGKRFSLFVDGMFTDVSFMEKSFTNTVNVIYKGSEIDQDSQTQTVRQKVIAKGADLLTEEKTIPYYLCFNTTGSDLVSGSDTLELEDNLVYKTPEGSTLNLMLDHDSIHVYRIRGVTFGEFKLTADMAATAVSQVISAAPNGEKDYAITEGMMMGYLEDITSTCPYTYSETTDASGNNVNTFKMTVPDSERILVTYSYKASGSGKIDGLTNSASIKGEGESSSGSESKIDITVQQSTADAVLVGINVYKVDSKNYAVHLNGAKFKLEIWDGTKWTDVQTYETGGEKGFFNTGELQDNTAYRLTETEAPAGYEMKTPSVYEFYIRNTAMGAHAECKPEGFAGRALNNGDDITIANDAFHVDVYKVDSQNHELHLQGAEFDLEKWDGSSWVKVKSYKTAGQEGTFAAESLEGNTAYRLIETKTPDKYDMNSAEIYEFYIPDTRIGAPAECKPVGFTGTAVSSGADITIENDLLKYSLPESGGIGTTLYTTGGLLLITAAFVTYLFGVRRRRERRLQ